MIHRIRTVPDIIIVVEIDVIMDHNGTTMSAMIAVMVVMVVIMIMTVNAYRHYSKRSKIGRIIPIMIRWVIGHINR